MLGKTFFNKKILIYGIGLSGSSCLNFLSKNNTVKLFDDNFSVIKQNNKKYFIQKKKIFKSKFDFIVLSPGINIHNCKLKMYLLENQKQIITELDIFYKSYPENLKITITGTNGKSSVCLMLYNIFKSKKFDVRLVGNIGKSPLEEKKINNKTIFIIEASSYQISYNKYFKTDYAAILNLNIDHLERHGTINRYAQAKIKLICDQKKNQISIIEKNNNIINKNILNKKIKSKIIRIKFDKMSFFKKKIKNYYLLDKNNLNNIHFVYRISKIFKISDHIIFKTLNLFKGLKFRKQIVLSKKNLKIINDSKSTSFSSSNGLLSTYKNIYWIVGGMYKKGDKFMLEKKYHKNVNAYIIGSNKDYFINQFKSKIKSKYLKNLKNAILAIKKDIKKDLKEKIILFSPAAASFDQFKNFEDRGRHFNSLIKKFNFYGK